MLAIKTIFMNLVQIIIDIVNMEISVYQWRTLKVISRKN